MHNSHQSFVSRRRMLDYDGNASNQVIWFIGPNPQRDIAAEALGVIDQWLANIRQHPELSVAQNKPADATDRCFTSQGTEIARGDHAWDGSSTTSRRATAPSPSPFTPPRGSSPAAPSAAASTSASSSRSQTRSPVGSTAPGRLPRASSPGSSRSSRPGSVTTAFPTPADRNPKRPRDPPSTDARDRGVNMDRRQHLAHLQFLAMTDL